MTNVVPPGLAFTSAWIESPGNTDTPAAASASPNPAPAANQPPTPPPATEPHPAGSPEGEEAPWRPRASGERASHLCRVMGGGPGRRPPVPPVHPTGEGQAPAFIDIGGSWGFQGGPLCGRRPVSDPPILPGPGLSATGAAARGTGGVERVMEPDRLRRAFALIGCLVRPVFGIAASTMPCSPYFPSPGRRRAVRLYARGTGRPVIHGAPSSWGGARRLQVGGGP